MPESFKRALPDDFVDKTTDEAVKQIRSFTVPEFENKGNKIGYEANNSIMEKIDEAIRAIEKGKIERCQEKLVEGKKIIHSRFISSVSRSERDKWITEASEEIIIAVTISEGKASHRRREVFS